MNLFKFNNTNNKKLEKYVRSKFGINLNEFLEVLKMSPGAEGYIHGSLSEFLFKKYIPVFIQLSKIGFSTILLIFFPFVFITPKLTLVSCFFAHKVKSALFFK